MRRDASPTMLQNLHVVSSLKAGQKLFTNEAVYEVRDVSLLASLARRWLGEERQRNVDRVADLYTRALLTLSNSPPGRETDRLTTVLRQSIGGLAALQDTYRDDVAVVSRLRVVCDSVSDFLSTQDDAPLPRPVYRPLDRSPSSACIDVPRQGSTLSTAASPSSPASLTLAAAAAAAADPA